MKIRQLSHLPQGCLTRRAARQVGMDAFFGSSCLLVELNAGQAAVNATAQSHALLPCSLVRFYTAAPNREVMPSRVQDEQAEHGHGAGVKWVPATARREERKVCEVLCRRQVPVPASRGFGAPTLSTQGRAQSPAGPDLAVILVLLTEPCSLRVGGAGSAFCNS